MESGVVHFSARTREVPVACPDCGRSSARVHSRYSRTLADLAVGGRPVSVGLSVRRLFCDRPRCGRRTFAEQVEGLTVRYQRRTPLLQQLVEMAAVLLAARGGSRLLRILNVQLSRTSVLFHLMRMPQPVVSTPRVLGVDDFALYAGTYGTLLVDVGTRLPLTLWEGRDADTLSAWLSQHPGVEVVCRDGSPTYRQGITAGAPDALQVSDRFHLWQGLSRRVQEIAATHRGCLRAATPDPEPAPSPASADPEPEAADTPARRHAKRLFEAVHAVTDTASGRSYHSIARELGLNRRTVRKYARATTWQECIRRRYPRRPTPLDPCLGYLRQRWDEGEHNALVLHQEIAAKGYRGHYQQVKLAVQPLRRGLPLEEVHDRAPTPRKSPAGSPLPLTSAASTSAIGSACFWNTARNYSAPTSWSASSTPCSTPRTPPCCPPGSTNSPHPASRPWPAWPRPSARTKQQSYRGSPPPSARESTKAASPTSNFRRESWEDEPVSPCSGNESYPSPTSDAAIHDGASPAHRGKRLLHGNLARAVIVRHLVRMRLHHC